jgi:hypothetical protein
MYRFSTFERSKNIKKCHSVCNIFSVSFFNVFASELPVGTFQNLTDNPQFLEVVWQNFFFAVLRDTKKHETENNNGQCCHEIAEIC